MNALELLQHRRSTASKLLHEPGPDAVQLATLLEMAMRVPDHGKLEPFRLLSISGEARHQLGEFLAQLTKTRNPAAEIAVIEKDRLRFSHAPILIVAIAKILPGHKIPEQEQLLSAGCVCYNLLLGAQALGFGAQWLTGWPAYDSEVNLHLGLMEHEHIIGFIHIGSGITEIPERPRPKFSEKVAVWKAPVEN